MYLCLMHLHGCLPNETSKQCVYSGSTFCTSCLGKPVSSLLQMLHLAHPAHARHLLCRACSSSSALAFGSWLAHGGVT